jgi:glycosyltransferase involved in cell wall biosynthesis
MRVLIVIDDLRLAGAQRVILQEIRALHPHAMDFQVVALAQLPEPSFARELARLGIPIHYLQGRGLIDPDRVLRLRKLIGDSRVDLVHTHLTYANLLGVPAARLAGRPVVASFHNVDSNQLRWPYLKRHLEGLIVRHLANRSVVVCGAAREATSRSFGVPVDRMAVICNAVDPATIELPRSFNRARKRSELGAADHDQVVCSVARLDPSKGHAFLIRAVAVLQSRLPRLALRLILVGRGPEEERIRELAARLGVAQRVMLLGARDDVGEILAASDLFVLPSLNEGLSQALLEAMALAVPVVATNVGGTRELVQPGRTGWRVLPAQPIALADAMEAALRSPQAARTYARAARGLVTNSFTLPQHVAQLQSLYHSVLAA